MDTKICPVCDVVFTRNPKRSQAEWDRRVACCIAHAITYRVMQREAAEIAAARTADERWEDLLGGRKFSSLRMKPAIGSLPLRITVTPSVSYSGCAAAMCAG